MELFKLFGRIVVDNAEANKEIEETSGKASQTSSSMSGAFKKIGAAVATYLTVDTIKNFGKGCIEAAADANAASSQFSQVFGDLEGKASKSLSGIADSAGISENRMKGSFTKIAAFAKTTGMDTVGALSLSERAMIAVADSAAFYDRSLEETTESLQSFLKGNYENDAALGLSCTEVTRNAAANELYGKSFKDLSESQKQLTLLKMVEDANKASGALGQAARESDTWTNVTGNLKQAWTDFQAVLGANVLPVAVDAVKGMASAVESLTTKMPEMVNWCKEHKTIMTTLAIAVGTVTTAIAAYNIALNATAIVTKITTIATSAFGAVMGFITSPVTLVVLAIGALIAAGVALYQNWDKVTAFCSDMWAKLKEIWGNIKESVSTKIDEIKTAISEKFEAAKQTVSNIFDSMKNAVSSAWNTIKNTVQVALMFIGSLISAAFQIITLPWRFVWENCKEYVFAAWNAIKGGVSTALNAIKNTISKVWNAIKTAIAPILNAIKTAVSTAWNNIKSVTSTAFNAVKSVASSVWNAIKSAVTSVVNTVKSSISSAWNAVKSTTSSVFNSVKSVVTTVWNSIKSAISTAINNVKTTISSGLNSAKNTVSGVLSAIKNKFVTIFNTVKTTVQNAINKIKGMFNFKWSLPKLKMPHFSIKGKFSLDPPSVPKLSVSWYKKAMQNPMLLTSPTIFGYDAASGKYQGAGEAGAEVVSGANTLMNMIGSVVEGKTAAANEKVVALLIAILEAITGGNRELIQAILAGQVIKINEREFGRTVREYA